MTSRPSAVRIALLSAGLLISLPLQQANAEAGDYKIVEERVASLANDLVLLLEDEDLSSSCYLQLIELGTASKSVLTDRSFEALQDAVAEQLQAKLSPDCVVEFSREPEGTEAKDVTARLKDQGLSSFFYTMTFFPRADKNLMLLATAYRPDGRFAAFSGPLTVETQPITGSDSAADTNVEPSDPALTATPSATGAASTEAASTENAPRREQTAGTSSEIDAIIAMKRGVMPTAKPAEKPESRLRIDLGGAAKKPLVAALAQEFLLEQAGGETSAARVDVLDDVVRLSGDPDAELQRVEIVDSGSEAAFDKLLRGDVDLILSTEPISQADYDRFAEAFGVDMRSGAGETVIGIDARGILVHPSNRLQRLDKGTVVDLLSDRVASWSNAEVAASGLSGPIETLAIAKGDSLYGGYTLQPDLTVSSNADIARWVAENPQAIGYGSVVGQTDQRFLDIEECGIVYSSDDFFMRTEDHPLARRIFLYSNPGKGNRFRNGFLYFVTSDDGQETVAQHLVNLEAAVSDRENARERIGAILRQPAARRDSQAELIDILKDARRLSTTFRFRFDSDELRLDQSAARDLANLIRLSQSENVAPERLMILGFADSDGGTSYNLDLSRERAQAIAKRLSTYGVQVPEEHVIGFGEEAPVACNDDDYGKARNRRVEVWLQDTAF